MIKKWWVLGLDGVIILFCLAAPAVTRWMMDVLPPCVFYEMGVLCPACGGTRCVRSFFVGEFLQALTFNPFFFFVILYVCLLVILLNIGLFTSRLNFLARGMMSTKAIICWACLFAIFGIARLIFC